MCEAKYGVSADIEVRMRREAETEIFSPYRVGIVERRREDRVEQLVRPIARDGVRDFASAHLWDRLVAPVVQSCVPRSVWSPNASS